MCMNWRKALKRISTPLPVNAKLQEQVMNYTALSSHPSLFPDELCSYRGGLSPTTEPGVGGGLSPTTESGVWPTSRAGRG